MDDSEAVDPGACFLPEQLSRLESGDLLKLSPVTRVIDDAGADCHVDTSVGKERSRRHSVGKERSEEHTDRSDAEARKRRRSSRNTEAVSASQDMPLKIDGESEGAYYARIVYGAPECPNKSAMTSWFGPHTTLATPLQPEPHYLPKDPKDTGVSPGLSPMSCCEDYPDKLLPVEPPPPIHETSLQRMYNFAAANPMRYTGVPLSVINCSADVLVVQSILGISAIARRDIACNQRLGWYEGDYRKGDAMINIQVSSRSFRVVSHMSHAVLRPQPYVVPAMQSHAKAAGSAPPFDAPCVVGSPDSWTSYVDDMRGRFDLLQASSV